MRKLDNECEIYKANLSSPSKICPSAFSSLTALVCDGPADLVLLVGPVAGLDEVDLAGEAALRLDVAEAVQVDPTVGAPEEVVDARRYLVPLVHLHVGLSLACGLMKYG